MRIEYNKETMCRLYEAINRGDYQALDHIFSPQYREHATLAPWVSPSYAGVKQYTCFLRSASPDLQFEILDMAAEKDKVWCRVRMTGTQREEFDGIPATGNRVYIERIDIYRLAEQRIIEHWSIIEQLSLFQQLGQYLSLEISDL